MSEIKTSELTDAFENDSTAKLSLKEKILIFAKRNRNKMRRLFATSSERSAVASLIENVYFALLSCKTRIIATFLLAFSIVSLVFSYSVSPSFNYFLIDKNTFGSIIVLVTSLPLFASNASVHELISKSIILSKLSIIYNEHNSLFSASQEGLRFNFTYSSAFFIGILLAIVSVFYPVTAIISFVVSLIFAILIFHRPECGLLTSLFFLPFLQENYIICFSVITLFSYLYRFLIGKRHMDFGIIEILLIICVIYTSTKAHSGIENSDFKTLICYLTFFLNCIFTINIVTTTAMFRRVLNVLIRMTRVYSVLLLIYVFSNLFFSDLKIDEFLTNLNFKSVTSTFSNYTFILSFLVIAIPLNFAQLIISSKKQDIFSGILFCAVMLFCAGFVDNSYKCILVVMLSCVAVLFFIRKKFIFLSIVCPFAAHFIDSLCGKIHDAFIVPAKQYRSTGFSEIFSNIDQKILLGNGFENTSASSTFLNVLTGVGVIGFTIYIVTFAVLLVKSSKVLYMKNFKAEKLRFFSAGLIISSVAFIIMAFLYNMMSDFRCAYLFACVLSLSCTSVRCYNSDYIDLTSSRDYI